MTRMQRVRALAVAAGVLVFGACSDDAAPRDAVMPGPEPGTVAVVLHTPSTDVGAVSFTIAGLEIANLRPATDHVEVFSEAGGAGWSVAALGTGLGGELVRFDVPDLGALSRLTAALSEVADERNEIEAKLDGYRLEVVPVS